MRVILTIIFVFLIDWSLSQHPSQHNGTIQSNFRRPLQYRVLTPGARLQNLNSDSSIRYRSPQYLHSIRHYNGAASSRAYRTSQNIKSIYIDRSQGVKTIRYVIPGIRTIYNTRYVSPGSNNITINKNITTFHRVGQNHNGNAIINKNITYNRIGPNLNINKTITFHRVGQNIDKNTVIRAPIQIRHNFTNIPARVPLNTGQITNCLRCHCISQRTIINIRCQACCSTSQEAVMVHHHRCASCEENHVHHRSIHQYKIHHPPNYRICKYYRRVMHGNRARRSSAIRRIWSSKCLPRRY